MRILNYLFYRISSEYKYQEQTLKNISSLFSFKINKDDLGNEFVVLSSVGESNGDVLPYSVNNKTEYEAMINHIHICERISKEQMKEATLIANSLIHGIYATLKNTYPNRKFVVSATINEEDSFIIRFHQRWPNEPPYYDPKSFDFTNAMLLIVQDEDC